MRRMLSREGIFKNAGVAGYAEAFGSALSGQAGKHSSSYLRTVILDLLHGFGSLRGGNTAFKKE